MAEENIEQKTLRDPLGVSNTSRIAVPFLNGTNYLKIDGFVPKNGTAALKRSNKEALFTVGGRGGTFGTFDPIHF